MTAKHPDNRFLSFINNNEDSLPRQQSSPWEYAEKTVVNSESRNVIMAPDLFAVQNPNSRNMYYMILKAVMFYPENISVKQNGRMITFECRQAERCVDGCWLSSVVVRKLVIPDSVNLKYLETRINNNYTVSIVGLMPKQGQDLPVSVSVHSVNRQPPQYPRNVVPEPRTYDVQTSQRLMEAAYRSMNAPGYSYWSMYPETNQPTTNMDMLRHLQMQYGCKPIPPSSRQGNRQVQTRGQAQGFQQQRFQNQPIDNYQGFQQDYSQAYQQDYSPGYQQGPPNDIPRSYQQGRFQVYPQGFAQDYTQNYPEYSQAYIPEYPQGYSQGRSQTFPQRPQGPPPTPQRVPMSNGNPPAMKPGRNMGPPKDNSPEESYEILSAPSEEDDEENYGSEE